MGRLSRLRETSVCSVVIGTTGFDLEAVHRATRDVGLPCFYGPSFTINAVLMMRFAE